ncbi:ferredoxin [Candidatus Woesearchaeota archaeon]|nr:ferredoxin [Candidatus Woesearchaeota archaeon]
MSDEKKEKKYKLLHDRPGCIGCSACAAVAPDHWEMADDGKSDIINGKDREDGWQEKDISEEEFKENMEAAESCPVNVIHLKRLKDEKDLI